MAPVQPLPSVPARWREVRLHDLGWLLRYGWRAACEMARARRRLGKLNIAELRARNIALATQMAPVAHGKTADPLMPERVAFIVPRLARLLPFRSDCLIQATGAQAWLAQYGVLSRIVIGVERPCDGPFAAHAWLEYDGKIITGGDVAQYTALL